MTDHSLAPDIAGASADPQVCVLTRYLKSWPVVLDARKDRRLSAVDLLAECVPLSEALTKAYPGDHHFVAYVMRLVDLDVAETADGAALPGCAIRLNTAALGTGCRERLQPTPDVELALLVVDVDDAAHESGQPASAEWRQAERFKLARLQSAAPGFVRYETRGGYRLIWALERPFYLDSQADADAWKDFYAGALAWLKANSGVDGDPGCADWTRLYRLPNVEREGKGAQQAAVEGALTTTWPADRVVAVARKAKRGNESTDATDPDPGDPAVVGPLVEKLSAVLAPAWCADGRQQWFLAFVGWLHGKGWSECERADLIDLLTEQRDDGAERYGAMNERSHALPGPGAAVKAALGDAFKALDKLVRQHPNVVATRPKSPRTREAARATEAANDTGEEPARARVQVTPNQSETNAAVVQVLAVAKGLYQRNQRLVRVIEDDSEEYSGAIIREMPAAALQSLISEHVHFWRLAADGKGEDDGLQWREAECHPPEWCVRYVHAAGEWPGIAHLTGIIETPAVRPDGSIIQEPGYDHATGFYFAPSEAFPAVPSTPTHADAQAALRLLREVFQDFPFKSGADRDVPIAAVLTLVSRPAVKGAVPAFLLDASMSRSGKGFITNVISLIALGRSFAPMNYPSSKSEQEKVLSGYALRGVPLVCFDNIESAVFGGGPIERAVTAEDRIALRVLGRSETPEVAWRAIIVGSGNNVECTRDMSARIMRARLEPNCERPEDRAPNEFAHYPLLPWVKAERARLVTAALVIVRAYFVAGQPRPVNARPIADFAAWARVVRDALVWAGGEDVAVTRAEAARTDTHGSALATVLGRMLELDPRGRGLSAREWLGKLNPSTATPGTKLAMLDALEELCPKEVTARAFGLVLRSAAGRIVGGLKLTKPGTDSQGVRWCVVRV